METNTDTATTPALADLVSIGDFFTCSWGYDQTNVNFYEVVAVTKASVKVRAVASSIVDESANITHVAPLAGTDPHFDSFVPVGTVATKRARIHQDTRWNRETGETQRVWTVSIRFESYAFGHLWDCKPVYETASGWGH